MSLAHWLADLSKVEKALGLPDGYIEHLSDEDDWSYVIKAHALTEAYLVHAIETSTDKRLAGLWDRLPFSGPAGTISIAKSLEIVDEACGSFAERLSHLRNRLTHGVGHPKFSFTAYFASSNNRDLQGFARDIALMVFEERNDELERLLVSMLAEIPKEVLSLAHVAFIARILFALEPAEGARGADQASSAAPIIAILAIVLAAVIGARDSSGS
jgi:hypothetical protein